MSIQDVSKSTSWFSLPRGVFALFCIQMFSTLSFAVLYSTIVLYITQKLGLSSTIANSITGVFIAFNFALHLLGGYIGGRFLSYRVLFSLGMIAQVLGCCLLATGQVNYLYWGLGAFLTGSGLNVTCINCMLTEFFSPEDTRRETAFLYNYSGMNIGFFVGFTLSGYFQLHQNYSQLFILSSLGNLLALILCWLSWSQLADKHTQYRQLDAIQQKKRSIFVCLAILLMPFILSQLLQVAALASQLVLATGVIMVAVALGIAKRESSILAREKLYAFIMLMLTGTIFWALFHIAPMGLTHFIANNVDRNWFFMIIPPQWFQNINAIAIMLGGPLLSMLFKQLRHKGIDVNIPTQFAVALVLIGLAFVILPIGISQANAQGLISSNWIILSFILQSVGELLISPIGYAMVGALVPNRLQGIMMGMWMLVSGIGATLASYSSNWMTVGVTSSNPLATNPGYSQVFLKLGLLAIAVGVLLALFVPLLKRWINETKEQIDSQTESCIN